MGVAFPAKGGGQADELGALRRRLIRAMPGIMQRALRHCRGARASRQPTVTATNDEIPDAWR